MPVGRPLPPGAIPALPDQPAPADAPRWANAALLDDLAAEHAISDDQLTVWAPKTLDELYREGYVVEDLIGLGGLRERDVLVPLAHQSVLAGILLAVQLLAAAHPDLQVLRPAAVEGRFDVLQNRA